MTVSKGLDGRGPRARLYPAGFMGGHLPERKKAKHVGPDPKLYSRPWQLSCSHREDGCRGWSLQGWALTQDWTKVNQLRSVSRPGLWTQGGTSHCIVIGLGDPCFTPRVNLGLHPLCTSTGRACRATSIKLTSLLSFSLAGMLSTPQCRLGPQEVP